MEARESPPRSRSTPINHFFSLGCPCDVTLPAEHTKPWFSPQSSLFGYHALSSFQGILHIFFSRSIICGQICPDGASWHNFIRATPTAHTLEQQWTLRPTAITRCAMIVTSMAPKPVPSCVSTSARACSSRSLTAAGPRSWSSSAAPSSWLKRSPAWRWNLIQ